MSRYVSVLLPALATSTRLVFGSYVIGPYTVTGVDDPDGV